MREADLVWTLSTDEEIETQRRKSRFIHTSPDRQRFVFLRLDSSKECMALRIGEWDLMEI